jgi:hypothetical protein
MAMKTLSFLALTLIVTCLAGCASGGAPQAAGGPPANVAGTWSGGTVGAGGVPATLQLAQNGSAVTGNIDIGGRPDMSGPIKGSVDGNTVRFKLDTGYGSTGELSVNGNTITGFVAGTGVSLQRK